MWESNPPITACKAAKNPSSITALTLVRVEGIEPSPRVSKTRRLPLSYTQIKLVPQSGIEPTSPAYKTGPHPLKVSRAYLAYRQGFEPRLVVLETIVLPLTLAIYKIGSLSWERSKDLCVINTLLYHWANRLLFGTWCRTRTYHIPLIGQTFYQMN